MSDKLERKCNICGGSVWCGRGCANAPPGHNVRKAVSRQIAEERFPWDDDEPEVPEMVTKVKAKRKGPDTIRFPQEVKDYFQKEGPGWQKRINEVLLEYVRGRT